MTDERCGTCKLWNEDEATPLLDGSGNVVKRSAYYRYHAPTTGRDPWPRTFDTDVCGRWKPKKKDDPE